MCALWPGRRKKGLIETGSASRTVENAAAPIVLGQGLISSAGANEFLTIKGIDPALEGDVTNVARSMTAGSLDALTPSGPGLPGEQGIVLLA